MRLPLTPPAASAGDRLAAELVEDLANRLQAGEAVDLEAYVRQHPECADRLRRLLPAVRMLAGLGRSAAGQPAAGPTPGPLPPVLGDFRILREVGRGGMGIVFEAEQVSLRRRVALKVLPFAAVLDPRQLQRFQNEARAAASLHHPNIVPVFAVGHDRGVHFYAMQFIEGQTLAALIHGLRQAGAKTDSRTAAPVAPPPTAPYVPSVPGATPPAAIPLAQPVRPPRPPSYFRRVALLGVQAAEALEHAHQTGVVHRDVKPANLLLDQRGNLWVADFGLAQFQADAGLTASGDLVGTLRYMSPEQAQGRRWTDHRVDVYSLGATLYEMLTLEPAFPGSDRQELLRQIAAEEPRPPRRIDRAIPADLETIVGKAMAKSPDERYGSARALADDLQRFLEDRPIRARPPSLWQKGRRWARRNRPLVWSVALFLALSLVGSLLGAVYYAAQRDQMARHNQTAKEQSEKRLYRAEEKLYHARLGRAESRRMARVPGYRRLVWDDLHEAARQDVPARNMNDIRDQVLACLGDPIGLDPIPFPSAPRVRRPPLPEVFQKQLPRDRPDCARAVSPDGRRFAFSHSNAILYLLPKDLSWSRWVVSELGGIYDLTFTPDGRTLVAGCEQGIVFWDVSTPPYLMVRSSFRAGNIMSVAVHPGGRLLATAGRGGRPELWNLASNQRIAHLPEQGDGATVEFSADGKLLLAVAGGRAVKGWPVTETPEKRLLEAPQKEVPSVAFSPDGRLLASGSKDGTTRVWDVASGRVVHTCRPAGLSRRPAPDFSNTIESVAFSPDGKLLAAGTFYAADPAVRLWDVASGREVGATETDDGTAPPGQVWRVQFSADGKYLVAGGGRGVAVWEVRPAGSGVTLRRCREVTPPGAGPAVYDLALHPGGTELVFLSSQGDLYACNLKGTAGPRPLGVRAANKIRCLEYDDAGEYLTFVTRFGKLALWDRRKAALARDTGVDCLHAALGAGGRWAAVANARHEVTVYDLKAGQKLLTLPPELGDIWSVAWSPDATRLAVGLSDGGIAVWDLERVRARLAEFGIAIPSTARGNRSVP